MNGTNQNQSLGKSELRYYFIRLTIYTNWTYYRLSNYQLFFSTGHCYNMWSPYNATPHGYMMGCTHYPHTYGHFQLKWLHNRKVTTAMSPKYPCSSRCSNTIIHVNLILKQPLIQRSLGAWMQEIQMCTTSDVYSLDSSLWKVFLIVTSLPKKIA